MARRSRDSALEASIARWRSCSNCWSSEASPWRCETPSAELASEFVRVSIKLRASALKCIFQVTGNALNTSLNAHFTFQDRCRGTFETFRTRRNSSHSKVLELGPRPETARFPRHVPTATEPRRTFGGSTFNFLNSQVAQCTVLTRSSC